MATNADFNYTAKSRYARFSSHFERVPAFFADSRAGKVAILGTLATYPIPSES